MHVRPPALEAARVEALLADGGDGTGRYVLYARLIVGELQRVETKLGPDHFRWVAGAAAEFALLRSDGQLLTSGVRTALQSSTMKLSDPDSFRQRRLNYLGQERAEAD